MIKRIRRKLKSQNKKILLAKKTTPWSVYMVRASDNSIYTGISTDVARRIEEHSSGNPKGARYLKGKGPLQLLLQKKVGNKSDASKVEWQIKQISKSKKEDIVSGKIKWRSFLQSLKKPNH